MKELADNFVTRLVRAWVSLYTHGLPCVVRDARRSEIDSDLWEHQQYLKANGSQGLATGTLGRVLTGMPSDILWSIEERRAAWGIVSMDNQLARERRLQSAIIFGISTFVVMLALVAIEGFPTAASVLVGGLAVLAIGGVVSSRVGNPISDTPCAGKEVYMDSNRHGTRRFRLLTVLALSVVTLGTMAAYAFSLEAWGDTLTVLFSIVGSAVMAVGLVALLLLIADLVRARGT